MCQVEPPGGHEAWLALLCDSAAAQLIKVSLQGLRPLPASLSIPALHSRGLCCAAQVDGLPASAPLAAHLLLQLPLPEPSQPLHCSQASPQLEIAGQQSLLHSHPYVPGTPEASSAGAGLRDVGNKLHG